MRGLERRKIFSDNDDRAEFLRRLAKALGKSGSHCHAWVLRPNHFHLLIQTGKKPISDLMRSLMSGYAGYFNRKYHRSGYLVKTDIKQSSASKMPIIKSW